MLTRSEPENHPVHIRKNKKEEIRTDVLYFLLETCRPLALFANFFVVTNHTPVFLSCQVFIFEQNLICVHAANYLALKLLLDKCRELL